MTAARSIVVSDAGTGGNSRGVESYGSLSLPEIVPAA